MMKWLVSGTLIFFSGFYLCHWLYPEHDAQALDLAAAEIQQLKIKISSLQDELMKMRATPEIQSLGAPKSRLTHQDADVKATSPNQEPNKPEGNWIKAEKTYREIRTPNDVFTFLNKAKIEDFLKELQSAKPATQMDEALEYLNGTFTGNVVSQSQTPGFSMWIQAALNIQNQVLKGKMSVRLSRDGKVFSRNSNNGEIRSIQKFEGKSAAILLTTGDYSFQLYYLPQLDSFEGNCYFQNKPGSLIYAGIVHLDRL